MYKLIKTPPPLNGRGYFCISIFKVYVNLAAVNYLVIVNRFFAERDKLCFFVKQALIPFFLLLLRQDFVHSCRFALAVKIKTQPN